jgi:osmotically-inducible protein OsmY
MNDRTLRQDILDELEFEPSVDANDIGVAVEDGIVTLSGHVSSYSQKLAAEQAAARVKGVRGIAEEIKVRYVDGTSDDEIARRAVNCLNWSTTVPADKVQVVVQDGWVTLKGKLDWHHQKVAAANAMRGLHGVTGISNLIELVPRVAKADVKKRIEDALKRNAEVEAKGIQIDVAGSQVTLKGQVKAWNERRIVEQAAWATPGVSVVSDHLTIG